MAGSAAIDERGDELLALYDRALPQVYGYLVARCGDEALAEDLTAEAFLAAVDGIKRNAIPNLTIAWLVGVARHKLVDHWRRREREDRKLALVQAETPDAEEVSWDERLDAARAHDILESMGEHHRCALTLRYLDGLSVPEVAELMGRTVHATEALLVRARSAFRRTYEANEGGSDDA